MVVEVDVIIIRALLSLYHFHLVTPAACTWVREHVEEHHDKVVKVLEVERKSAWDILSAWMALGCGLPRDTGVLP